MRQTTKTNARKGAVAGRLTASADRPGEGGAGAAMRESASYRPPEAMPVATLTGLFTDGATLH